MMWRGWCEGDDTKLLLHNVKGMILNYCSVCLSVLSVCLSVCLSACLWLLVSVRCPPSLSWQCSPAPTGCWCVVVVTGCWCVGICCCCVMLVSVRCPPSLSWQCCPTPTGCWCVGMLLLCDVSKREVSTQPKLTVLPRAYRMLVWIAVLV